MDPSYCWEVKSKKHEFQMKAVTKQNMRMVFRFFLKLFY